MDSGTAPDAKVKTLDRLNSGHYPIMISISSRNFGPKCFKIFNHWMNEDGFSNVVEASWGNMVYNGPVDIVLKNKLKNLRKDIKDCEFTLGEFKEADLSYFEKFGCLTRGCNASFIVLIPKNSDHVDLGDYRPISLIGCMYKVLSKLLSRRLCKVIHKLIRPNQTTFLSGRQILDSILIANETVNYAKKEKLKLLIFKVDFEKAFDSVNWKFLIDIMSQMGFSAKWCKLIHACLSSASISVLINGSPSKEFSMERGLRQGDPMSPFLFLIIAEALIMGKRLRKIEALDEVVNRFSKRLSMWKAMLLSVGGRLTLVKAVLGSLPLYFFSVFKAPKAVISRLDSIRRRFL
ncbi:RNA-directed DNA polymerase, eukaryota, reverse transcriptase zinc-binding domain protein [Tanacetum coccineum]|uniref:RNA-directed DNA polymerase, eukaryota, reverse transcriptase zinc-binding domain protein n=1 Tax=Tanacetum coccineum TaxID=301880 RepID=A0ABQ5FEG7_9ASTR